MTLSLVIITASCVWFALSPTYSSAIGVWTILAIALCGFYPAIYKLIRIIAPENRQGNSYGIFGACNALGYMVINFTALSAYQAASETGGAVKGLSAIVWVFAAVLFIATVAGYLLVRGVKNPEAEASEIDRFSFADLKYVFKMPGTWLVFSVSFGVSSLHLGMSYFTPYFTNVLGTALVFSGTLAVVRQYGLRLVASPLGGWYGDKIGSTTRVIRFAVAVAAFLVGAIMFLPPGTALAVIVILVLVTAFMDNISFSLCYSIVSEALIPRRYTGTVLGLITIILPDLFLPPMYGHWLDTYGNDGYYFIFGLTILLCAISAIGATVIIHRAKKYRQTG